MQAGLQIPAMESGGVKFGGHTDGIEPVSPAIQTNVLTTTPQCPGTNSVKFALSYSTIDYW